MNSYKIGDIYLMKFTGSGSEQCGWRPGIVFQNNVGNIHSPNIIALPLTTSTKKINQPTHVLIKASKDGLKKDSIVICENPERMSKCNIGQHITSLSDDDMKKVVTANLLATSAISFLDFELLLATWKKATMLNGAA